MELLRLLQINEDRIPRKALLGAKLCDSLWHQHGCPAAPAPLMKFLDEVLKRCQVEQVWYPAPVLLRLKQLQRGVWKVPPGWLPPAPTKGGSQRVRPAGICDPASEEVQRCIEQAERQGVSFEEILPLLKQKAELIARRARARSLLQVTKPASDKTSA